MGGAEWGGGRSPFGRRASTSRTAPRHAATRKTKSRRLESEYSLPSCRRGSRTGVEEMNNHEQYEQHVVDVSYVSFV